MGQDSEVESKVMKSRTAGCLKQRHRGDTGTFLRCWLECKMSQPLWEPVWQFLEMLNTELSNDSAIP